MASNLSKQEIVNNALDKKIKNLAPALRERMFGILMASPEATSIAACMDIVYKSHIQNDRLGKKSRQYWINRGWTSDQAYVKAKDNEQTNCKSVYSQSYWLEKTNPATGNNYTAEEADFERNSRRPIRKEYWIKLGYSDNEALELAKTTKDKNNKKGAKAAGKSVFRRVTSKRCAEYFIARGHSPEEAAGLVSENQKFFSKDICIKKYGEEEGTKIWQKRQEQWQANLNAKPDDEKARINRLKLTKGITVSKSEKIILDEIRQIFPDAVHQFTLHDSNKKQYIYDIMVNNKIIEYNGDFWHLNPSIYSPNFVNSRTKLKAVDKWVIDSVKLQHAQDLGYDVLVIWESDFKKRPQEIIQKCIQFLIQ